MGAPGTLIPAEVPSCNLQNFGLDTRTYADISENVKNSILEKVTETASGPGTVVTASTSTSVAALSKGAQSKKDDKNVGDKNQMERFEYDFGKLLPSLCKSNEGLLNSGEKPSAAKKLQVKDVSKYVISAAKNPDFAQKLHAVLLENGATPSSDLFSNINPQYQGEENMLAKSNIYDGNMVDWGAHCNQTFLPNDEQSLIQFTGVRPFNNVLYDSDQKHMIKRTQTVQDELNFPNSGYMLPSFVAKNEGSVLDNTEMKAKISTHDANTAGSSELVASILDLDLTNVCSISHAYDPFNGQPGHALLGNDALCSNASTADVSRNIKRQEETCMQLITTTNSGQHISCSNYNEKSTPVLVEVAEWEIPWEDLQVFERIGIGKILQKFLLNIQFMYKIDRYIYMVR